MIRGFRQMALSVICMAMALLLFSSLLPHHHHGHEVCVTYELCEIDGSLNDEHTAHQCHAEDRQMPHEEAACPFAMQDYVKPSLQSGLHLVLSYEGLQLFLNEYFYHFSTDLEGELSHQPLGDEMIRRLDYEAFHSFRAPPIG